MAKGRRSGYYKKVKPNLELIKKLKLDGVEIKKICKVLGIATSSGYEYVDKFPELNEISKIEKVMIYDNGEVIETIEVGELTDDIIENSTFSLTVLIQEDPYDIDECDELVMTIRKYETIGRRMTVE